MTAIKVDDKTVAAGVNVSRQKRADDGFRLHTPIHVLSLLYTELNTGSIRQTIPLIVSDTVKTVSSDCKLLIFKSGLPQFRQYKRLMECTQACSMKYGVEFRFIYRQGLDVNFTEIRDLCDDAIRRGYSLDSAI